MVTETEARRLLRLAADTIEEPPLRASSPRRSRSWVWVGVGVAAELLLVVGAMTWFFGQPGADVPTPPASSPSVPAWPADQIPPVSTYDAVSAQQMLAGLGLNVTVEDLAVCRTPGRAIRTDPLAGNTFASGDSVTLFVSILPKKNVCGDLGPETQAWQLIDYANGRGPSPAFTSSPRVVVDGKPASLDEALHRIALASRYAEMQRPLNQAELRGHIDPGHAFVCNGQMLPKDLQSRTSTFFEVQPNRGDVMMLFLDCFFVNVFTDDQGAIDTLVVRSTGPDTYAPPTSTPSPQGDADPMGVGAAFLAFVRGESDVIPAPERVRLYSQNVYAMTVHTGDLNSRTAWNVFCPKSRNYCQRLSTVDAVDRLPTHPAVTNFVPTGCIHPSAPEPTDTGGTHQVVLGIPEPATCADDVAIQIWYDDEGLITAVNLLYGSE